jgi:aspartate aminotransferase
MTSRVFPVECRKVVFPDISDLFAKKADSAEISDSISFCSYILDEARVALVPGKAFGCDNFVRFSYATDMQSIKEAA